MTKVYSSSVIDAPVEKVWLHIRDFNGLPNWMPVVKDSHIEEGLPADQVGCIRNFNLNDGGNIREQLLSLSDLQHNFTYSILESPMAVKNYQATVELRKVTDGDRTYIQWTAEFDTEPEEEAGLIELIGIGVFMGGLDSLKKHFVEK
jgi:carbon monoxide dehydrogenase subunit G